MNRLEPSRAEPSRHHEIVHDAAAIDAVFAGLFLDIPVPGQARTHISVGPGTTDDPLHRDQEDRRFHCCNGGYFRRQIIG
jgi:hypothetical protein